MAALMKWMNSLAVLSALTINILEAAFTSTPGTVSGCVGDSATFTWVYDNQADADSVVWDFGSTNVFNYEPPTGNTVQGAPQFSGRVTHNGAGSITVGTLRTGDAGSYSCTVTYNSYPIATNASTLHVNELFTDSLSTILTVSGSTATVNLDSQDGVDVEWKNEAGTIVGTETTYTGEGKFTVCLIGCVSGSATTCQQIDLESGGLSEGDKIGLGVGFGLGIPIVAAIVVIVLYVKKLPPFKKGYKLGDLVWAKLERYPWWPSLVCNHPTELTHQKSRENPQIHVQLFDDPPSRAWIKAQNVKEFKGSDHTDFKEGGLFFSLSEDIQKGAKEADDAQKLTKEERLKLVVKLQPYDDTNEEGYKLGDLVWAKLERYPWWPSLVCNHPTELTHQKSRENPQIHVQFFDDPPSRAWIKAQNVKEFKGSDHANFREGGLFFSLSEDIQKGAKKADDAQKLTEKARLKLVVKLQPYGDKNEEDMEFHGYKLGDLVWAKLERYPWWPGLVCNHPTELTHQKSRENPQIHVQFFDDPPSRAWIKAQNVKKFRGSDHTDFKKGGLFFSLSKDVQKGAKEADDAQKLTKEERLKVVVELQPYDDKNEDIKFNGYKLGDLVWAKLEGYPWWPSLVCNHPTELTHQKSRENPQIHVQFFDDPESRAWINAKNIKKFRGSDHADFKKGGLFFSLNKDVQKGAKEADDALKLTKESRLRLVEDMEFDGYKLGDLVWAKLKGYPWWPGLVCNRPTELTHQKSRENPQIHVQFFDDSQSRAWIKAKNMKKFRGSDHADFKKGGLFFSLNKDVQKGAKEADDALKLTKESRLRLVEDMEFDGYELGDLVWAKLKGYPWWPGLVCNRPTELTHQKSRENPQTHVQFFDDSQSRAWIKAKNVKEFTGSDHADFKEGGLFFSLNKDVQKGAKEADDALKWTKESRLRLVEDMEFDDGTEKTIKTTKDKKIDRLSIVDEKALKPQTPGHLTADTVTRPKPGRPLPPKPVKKKKKKGSKKKRKKTENEDGGEDSVKVPSIEKKEKNMEHYTENKKEYES